MTTHTEKIRIIIDRDKLERSTSYCLLEMRNTGIKEIIRSFLSGKNKKFSLYLIPDMDGNNFYLCSVINYTREVSLKRICKISEIPYPGINIDFVYEEGINITIRMNITGNVEMGNGCNMTSVLSSIPTELLFYTALPEMRNVSVDIYDNKQIQFIR